jgi:two-component SAPR family response regulator
MTHNDLRYGFGPYELDPSKRILTRDGEVISLAPKATEILLMLVKHAGQLVEKDELLSLALLEEAEQHLAISKRLFDLIIRQVFPVLKQMRALPRLYLESKQFALAEEAIDRAVSVLELTDGRSSIG